jgi:hypothetical protein
VFDHGKKHTRVFQHYSQYEQLFDKVQDLELREFRWCGLYEECYWFICQTEEGFLKHFVHGSMEVHLDEPGDKSCETYRASWGPPRHKITGIESLPRHKNTGIEILKKWFNKNKGNHPPQTRRSVPEFILHAFR